MKIRKTQKSGFTLIELLVVIAIIGILAGLLFPAISGALLKAQAASISNNGKQFVTAVIAANIERDALNMGEIWPWLVGEITVPTGDSGTAQIGPYDSGKSSNDYFADMVGYKVLDEIDFSIFSGGGLKSAGRDREIFETGEDYNAWNIVSGVGDSSWSGDTPFMWTRNLSMEKADLESASPDEGGEAKEDNWLGKLDETVKPFGKKQVIMVTKGGAATAIAGKFFFNSSLFMRGAQFAGKNFEVLFAKKP